MCLLLTYPFVFLCSDNIKKKERVDGIVREIDILKGIAGKNHLSKLTLRYNSTFNFSSSM